MYNVCAIQLYSSAPQLSDSSGSQQSKFGRFFSSMIPSAMRTKPGVMAQPVAHASPFPSNYSSPSSSQYSSPYQSPIVSRRLQHQHSAQLSSSNDSLIAHHSPSVRRKVRREPQEAPEHVADLTRTGVVRKLTREAKQLVGSKSQGDVRDVNDSNVVQKLRQEAQQLLGAKSGGGTDVQDLTDPNVVHKLRLEAEQLMRAKQPAQSTTVQDLTDPNVIQKLRNEAKLLMGTKKPPESPLAKRHVTTLSKEMSRPKESWRELVPTYKNQNMVINMI